MPSESESVVAILEPPVLNGSRRRVALFGSSLLVRLSLCVPAKMQVDRISCSLKGNHAHNHAEIRC